MADLDRAVARLAKVVVDSIPAPSSGGTLQGTAHVSSNGDKYVQLDGSDQLTPVALGTDVSDGERVTVEIRDHRATVTVNQSSPGARVGQVEGLGRELNDVAARSVTTQQLDAATGRITNLESRNAEITGQLTAASADIRDLQARKADVESLEAATADIETLKATTVTADTAKATYATIESLKAAQGDIDTIRSNYATVESLDATNAAVKRLDADKADVADLEASYAHITDGVIDNARIDYAKVNSLDAHYAQIDLANVSNAWIDRGVVRDAAISDAQIADVSANKVTAGELDASKVRVTHLRADDIETGKLTVGGITIDLDNNKSEIDGSDVVDGTIKLSGLSQEVVDVIDSSIQTWTVTAVPTLQNDPASKWTTARDRDQHVGDIAYVVNAGNSADGFTYRFTKDSKGAYAWTLIRDNQVTAALDRLTKAEGDISGLQDFQSETSHWRTETDTEVSDLMASHTELTTQMETTQRSLSDVGERADAAKSSADATARLVDEEVRDLVTLRIDSSRGTVFHNSAVSTVLTVHCFKKGQEITSKQALQTAMDSSTARIRWWVLREGDESWVSLDDSDPKLSQDNFALTLTPDDVDVKCTFKAEVVTD